MLVTRGLGSRGPVLASAGLGAFVAAHAAPVTPRAPNPLAVHGPRKSKKAALEYRRRLARARARDFAVITEAIKLFLERENGQPD